jgi:hypothetical protein
MNFILLYKVAEGKTATYFQENSLLGVNVKTYERAAESIVKPRLSDFSSVYIALHF